MEAFTDDIPYGWTTTTPNNISEETEQGRVHSGNSSVNLMDGADLTQEIEDINPGCFYEFSFFAHGEGANVSFTATVTFETTTGDVTGASIKVNDQDLTDSNRSFAYYRAITIVAPNNVTGARIDFAVTANGQQSMDLDDVSFSLN